MPELPCKWVWSVALLKWVGDESNGMACPAEEHCDRPTHQGRFDGELYFGGCLAEDARVAEKRKRPR